MLLTLNHKITFSTKAGLIIVTAGVYPTTVNRFFKIDRAQSGWYGRRYTLTAYLWRFHFKLEILGNVRNA